MFHTSTLAFHSFRCSRYATWTYPRLWQRTLTDPPFQATTPVAVLVTTWIMGLAQPSMKTFGNVSIIVVGVIIASMGEIKFVLFGVLVQIAGILFEAIRLAMVQGLLSGSDFKMDPLVSLYYFAPACATMNFLAFLVLELPKMTMDDIARVGPVTLFANAGVAFMLNVAVVMLVSYLYYAICWR